MMPENEVTGAEEHIPLARVLAQCRCGWTGTADQLIRMRNRVIEMGGTETDARVVDHRDMVMVRCPECDGGLKKIELNLPEDLPNGTYHIDLTEGL